MAIDGSSCRVPYSCDFDTPDQISVRGLKGPKCWGIASPCVRVVYSFIRLKEPRNCTLRWKLWRIAPVTSLPCYTNQPFLPWTKGRHRTKTAVKPEATTSETFLRAVVLVVIFRCKSPVSARQKAKDKRQTQASSQVAYCRFLSGIFYLIFLFLSCNHGNPTLNLMKVCRQGSSCSKIADCWLRKLYNYEET